MPAKSREDRAVEYAASVAYEITSECRLQLGLGHAFTSAEKLPDWTDAIVAYACACGVSIRMYLKREGIVVDTEAIFVQLVHLLFIGFPKQNRLPLFTPGAKLFERARTSGNEDFSMWLGLLAMQVNEYVRLASQQPESDEAGTAKRQLSVSMAKLLTGLDKHD